MTTLHATFIPGSAITDAENADAVHKLTMSLYRSADLPGEPGTRRAGTNILWRRQDGGVLVTADIPATDLPDGASTFRIHTDFEDGDEVTFAVTFDPIARVRGRDRRVSDIDGWFVRHLGDVLTGITLEAESGTVGYRRGGPIRQMTYGGSAIVADAEKLRELVRRGVGRSKSFGCGMVEII